MQASVVKNERYWTGAEWLLCGLFRRMMLCADLPKIWSSHFLKFFETGVRSRY